MADQVVRKRVQSARPYTDRQRPLSSRPYKMEEKTEFIQKVYNNMPGLSERPSSGRNKMKTNSFHLTKNLKPKESSHENEVLAEENMHLKKKVNMLEIEMSQLHGKMVANLNKNTKITKKLDAEFKNETEWAGKSSYLVTGVKHQYEKLKAQYREKCEELFQIKQNLVYTKFEELQKNHEKLEAYKKSLLKKNILLEQRIAEFSSTSFTGGSASERNYKVSQLLIDDLKHKLAEKEEKLEKKKEETERYIQTLNAKIKREQFLDKNIIEKDNAIHALHIKNKKLEKEREVYLEEISNLRKRLEETEMESQFQIINIKESEERKVNKEREIYSNIINEKNMNIAKLEKEVAYLTTLMSYWKPLDEDKKINESPIKQINVVEVEQKKTEEEKSKKPTSINESLGLLGRTFNQRASEDMTKNRVKTEIETVDKPREQKRADVKRSEDAKKVRPVKDNEVEEIGELLRFRLIAKRVSINKVKEMFSKEISPEETEHEDLNSLWQNEYITMKEAHDILLQEPFNLSETQAHLLSRYLIEDVQDEYLYCAEDNENKREVVKSILKNTIKDYEINDSLEEIEKETSVELEKYQSRISTILQQMYKDGFISKKKLSEIFVGSGFELREQVMEYIIGKLAVESESLDRLKYTVLF